MAELRYDQLQARAINNMDDAAYAEGDENHQKVLIARAQVHATLSVAAALKDLAEAIRENR